MLYQIRTTGDVDDVAVVEVAQVALSAIIHELTRRGENAVVNTEVLRVNRFSAATPDFPYPVEDDILTCTFFHEGVMLDTAAIHAIFKHMGSLGPLLQHDPFNNIWYYRTNSVNSI